LALAMAGAVALVAGSGAGLAQADDEYGTDDVEVNVRIDPLGPGDGALSLTVYGDQVDLTESGSTALVRQFVGDLPTVKVSDTRWPGDIDPDAYWYVLGSVTDFSGNASQADIPAANLGWAPALIDGGALGLVSEGDEVDSILDSGPGLVDQELLAMTWNSADVRVEDEWTATAALTLKTDAGIEPGIYTALLTLSLFE
jgi:hypothetical protein